MRYFKLLALFGLLFIIPSCQKDPLDITPDGRITLSDVFKTQELTEAYLNTTYERLRKHGVNYHYYTFLSAFSDDAHESNFPTDNWTILSNYINGNFSAAANQFASQGSETDRQSKRLNASPHC